jgi:hypothetical protein
VPGLVEPPEGGTPGGPRWNREAASGWGQGRDNGGVASGHEADVVPGWTDGRGMPGGWVKRLW